MPIFVTISIVIVSAAAISLLAYYAFIYEPLNFTLTESVIFLGSTSSKKRKQPEERVLDILHLSDFHLRKDRKGRKLFKFVQDLDRLRPDLIFITGDLVEQDSNQEYLIEMLRPLKASIGKFAVFGVHDYYNKTPREFLKNMIKRKRRYRRENDIGMLKKRLGDIGIDVLENANVSTGNDLRLEIIGIGDEVIEKGDINKAFEGINTGSQNKRCKPLKEIEKAKHRSHLPNDPEKLRIVLTHTPDEQMICALRQREVDFVFCGHTHGGQVRLPGVGALISGCKISPRYASGLFYFEDIVLFVTRGLGEGRYSPLRFNCRPEASYIRVRLL